MMEQCHHCYEHFYDFSLYGDIKANVLENIRSNKKLVAVKIIQETSSRSLRESKSLADHITAVYDQCNQCKEPIKGDFVKCDNCGTVNYNCV